ncbi:MAG: hypothetical protein WDM79_00085 [Terricaulis sp.]
MWILRWPVALILLILVVGSVFPAIAVTVVHTDLVDLSGVSADLESLAQNTTWLEAGLWYGAALLFLVAAIRLMRRTQAFWAWLIGFALYGARWALTQNSQDGGLVATVQSLSVEAFQPENLTATAPATQVGLVVFHLAVGLLIFIIDAADRHYWDKQGA